MVSRRNNLIFCLVFLFCFCGAFLCNNAVFGVDFKYATGAAATSGGNNEAGNGYYNCYPESASRCPRWILVSGDEYRKILDNGRVVGSYDGLDVCRNDENVIIAGNQRKNGELQIFNLTNPILLPTKVSHKYASVGEGTPVENTEGNRWAMGFFGTLSGIKDKDDSGNEVELTWGDALWRLVREDTGFELNIAAFCPSMIEEKKYYARSEVESDSSDNTGLVSSTGSVVGKTITRNVSIGDRVPMSFAHSVYSSAIDMDNTWWSISRSVGDGGGNFYEFIVEEPLEMSSVSPVKFTVGPEKVDGADVYKPSELIDDSFVAKDIYWLEFNAEGKYTYCESLYMGNNNGLGESKQMTEVCSSYNVNKNNDDTTPVVSPDEDGGDGLCSKEWWRDYIYNKKTGASQPTYGGQIGVYGNENESSAYTYTLSGVKKKKKDTSTETGWMVSNVGNDGEFITGREVYVKPGDEVKWSHCYYPGIQAKANTEVTANHGEHSLEPSENTNKFLKNASSDWDMDWGGWERTPQWQNQFEVSSSNLRDSVRAVAKFDFGETDAQRWEEPSWHDIVSGYYSVAGDSLSESMNSGIPSSVTIDKEKSHDTYECKKEDGTDGTCTHSNMAIKYSVNDNSYKDTAMVKVPYNFKIDSVGLDLTDGVVFAGESVRVKSASVSVEKRQNNITDGTYATKVDQADIHMVTYVTEEDRTGQDFGGTIKRTEKLCGKVSAEWCSEDGKENKTLNYPENTGGSLVDMVEKGIFYNRINVADAEAGKWFCAALAVYPAEVSGNTDVKDSNGNTPWENDNTKYSWQVSSSVCRQIAKKPSVQIWGGGLYSNDFIGLPLANKKVLTEYVYNEENKKYDYIYDYDLASSGAIAFGTWVESGIVAHGLIGGLSSGAADGYYNPNNGERTPYNGVGGSYNSSGDTSLNSCILAPLTMPNYNCGKLPGYSLGGVGEKETFVHDDREALVSVFRNNGTSVSNKFNYEKIESSGDVSLRGFLNEKGIVSGTIPKSNEQNKAQTWILEVTGSDGKYKTLTIDEDVRYEDGGYTALSEIPKLIIYAGNINILCGVTRVDAVLITAEGGNINTCSDADGKDANDVRRSKQLKINGTIITDKLIAGRTYGAGTGSASAVPAEIIDYDTSLYLWAMQNAKGSNSGKMDVVYLTELAPRY